MRCEPQLVCSHTLSSPQANSYPPLQPNASPLAEDDDRPPPDVLRFYGELLNAPSEVQTFADSKVVVSHLNSVCLLAQPAPRPALTPTPSPPQFLSAPQQTEAVGNKFMDELLSGPQSGSRPWIQFRPGEECHLMDVVAIVHGTSDDEHGGRFRKALALKVGSLQIRGQVKWLERDKNAPTEKWGNVTVDRALLMLKHQVLVLMCKSPSDDITHLVLLSQRHRPLLQSFSDAGMGSKRLSVNINSTAQKGNNPVGQMLCSVDTLFALDSPVAKANAFSSICTAVVDFCPAHSDADYELGRCRDIVESNEPVIELARQAFRFGFQNVSFFGSHAFLSWDVNVQRYAEGSHPCYYFREWGQDEITYPPCASSVVQVKAARKKTPTSSPCLHIRYYPADAVSCICVALLITGVWHLFVLPLRAWVDGRVVEVKWVVKKKDLMGPAPAVLGQKSKRQKVYAAAFYNEFKHLARRLDKRDDVGLLLAELLGAGSIPAVGTLKTPVPVAQGD